MNKWNVQCLGTADQYFSQEGAVGYFDTYFPKATEEATAMQYKRIYFDLEDRQVGYFIPLMVHMGSQCSVYHSRDPRPWGKHPKLTHLSMGV